MIATGMNEQIKTFLESAGPVGLNLLGVIQNRNTDNFKIYVDNTDAPMCVLLNAGYFNYMYANESFDFSNLQNLFREFGKGIGFSGVDHFIFENLASLYKIQWHSPCRLMVFGDEEIEVIENEHLDELTENDVLEINEHYTYKSDTSISEIKDNIENRPTSCIRVDGELRSWVMVHEDNSLGIMFTKREYRGLGYAEILTRSLVDKVLKSGNVPYVQIIDTNDASLSLAKKCGFKDEGAVDWFGIILKQR